MRDEALEILACPRCDAGLGLASTRRDSSGEVREGYLTCADRGHEYEVVDGIVCFKTGLDHATVAAELAYEESTYRGDPRLTQDSFIARLPDSGAIMWPHTRHFGPDFDGLLDRLHFGPSTWTLDVGTAACWTTRKIAQRGGRAVALDVTSAPYYGLRSADIQARAHGVYFERVLESMTELSFVDGSFDHVVFHASFHHTPDLRATLVGAYRVLKPGGVVAMINEEFTSVRHALFGTNHQDAEEGAHHCVPYATLIDTAQELGFSLEIQLAPHVASELATRLGFLGEWLSLKARHLPGLIKQLDSGLVLLTKPR